MLQKLFTALEWVVACFGVGITTFTLLFSMFTDSPSFTNKFTSSQKIIFDIQGGVILLLVIGVVVSFICQFIFKQIPWRHIAACLGIIGITYSLIFFSLYFQK